MRHLSQPARAEAPNAHRARLLLIAHLPRLLLMRTTAALTFRRQTRRKPSSKQQRYSTATHGHARRQTIYDIGSALIILVNETNRFWHVLCWLVLRSADHGHGICPSVQWQCPLILSRALYQQSNSTATTGRCSTANFICSWTCSDGIGSRNQSRIWRNCQLIIFT